jgi:hypothetical protein
MAEIKLTLLENAENFLSHSLSEAIVAETSPQNWKYAILHLVQSIELSLKELLKREHAILIYKNVDKPKDTVSLDFAVMRLQNIANYKFKSEDLDTISLASKYRDQIVHHEFSFKEEEIKPIFAKLIGFLQTVFGSYFGKNLSSIINEGIWKEAVKIIEYTTELQKRAEDKFLKEGIEEHLIMDCRKCYQRAFVIQDDINTCYVCGTVDEVSQCDGCEEYFYSDELSGSHEFDDKQYCTDCLEHMRSQYYDILY